MNIIILLLINLITIRQVDTTGTIFSQCYYAFNIPIDTITKYQVYFDTSGVVFSNCYFAYSIPQDTIRKYQTTFDSTGIIFNRAYMSYFVPADTIRKYQTNFDTSEILNMTNTINVISGDTTYITGIEIGIVNTEQKNILSRFALEIKNLITTSKMHLNDSALVITHTSQPNDYTRTDLTGLYVYANGGLNTYLDKNYIVAKDNNNTSYMSRYKVQSDTGVHKFIRLNNILIDSIHLKNDTCATFYLGGYHFSIRDTAQ